MTSQETRRDLAAFFALMMTQLEPGVPESARRAYLVDMIVTAARTFVRLNGAATQAQITEVFDRIDGDVLAILAEMTAGPAGAVG
jgi:hypothetical protein